MICLTSHGWTGAEITWEHAIAGAETYAVTGDYANPYAVAVDLRDWLDSPSRIWAGSISSVTLSITESSDRLRFLYSFTGSNTTWTTVSESTPWIARMGASHEGIGVPPNQGTLACDVFSFGWGRWDRGEGGKTRNGSWRMEHPSVSLRRPSIELWMDQTQNAIWGKGLAIASDPAEAYVYDEVSATWRRIVIGEIATEHLEEDYSLIRASLSVLGVD